MLFEFKSKATGNLIMTDEVGRQALNVIGKAASVAGIITLAEMPAALQALKQAVGVSKSSGQGAGRDQSDEEPVVPLASRLLPLIEMIERSHKGGEDIIWGV